MKYGRAAKTTPAARPFCNSIMYLFKKIDLKPVPFAFASATVATVPIYLFIFLLLLVDWWPKPIKPDLTLPPILVAINAIVIAPVIETYLMVLILTIFNKITNTSNWSVVLTAIFFGLTHFLFDLKNPMVIPLITWGFFVFGNTLTYWKKKRPHSYLWIVMLAHAIANLATMAIQWL